jgi:uncharacterized Zn finger protein (UPF0148 family)
MITCKLCSTRLEKKDLRRDGSMLCPECGQIYWKAAVDKAMNGADIAEPQYRHESCPSARHLPRRVQVA